MSGVVTPEAVRLEFDAAGVGSRGVALGIDLLLQSALILLVVVAQGLVMAGGGAGLPDWVATTVALLVVFGVLWGYPVAFETLWRGRTPGKAAMGLRVVSREGAPVRFRHAAIRAALGLVDFYVALGGVAVISALVTREHQRLGDLVAGTLVLRERTGARAPTAARFTVPHGAEGYAATIDPSGLTVDDYAALRGFLLRADELAPDVRADLAGRIARPLAARLGHRLPDGMSPAVFVACAAARYQQRGGAGVGGAGGGQWAPDPAPSSVPAPPPAAPIDSPPTSSVPTDGGFAPPG